MSAVINPQKENNLLSEEQQMEILERDQQYEAGEAEVFTFDEFPAYLDTLNP